MIGAALGGALVSSVALGGSPLAAFQEPGSAPATGPEEPAGAQPTPAGTAGEQVTPAAGSPAEQSPEEQPPAAEAAPEGAAAGGAPAPAQAGEAPPTRPQAQNRTAARDKRRGEILQGWVESIDRDATLAFTRTSARRAADDLIAGFGDEFERSSALYALGATDAVDHLGLLETAAQVGIGFERLAAILALGELSLPPIDLLTRLLAEPDMEVRGVVLLAILRTGDDRALEQIAPLAGGRGPLGKLVSDLISFVRDPEQSAPTTPASLLLSLRWEAAKRYGLVDGRTWRAARIAELEADRGFLDSVLLPSVAGGRFPSIRDHLVAMLFEEPSGPVFEACLEALPSEFNLLVRNGVWVPSTPALWNQLMEALEDHGGAPELLDIYDRATGVPSLRVRAAAMQLIAGDPRGWEALAPLLAEREAGRRRLVAVALGRSGDRQWLGELKRLESDSDPSVRASALASRIAVGDTDAIDEAEAIIADEDSEDRLPLTKALTLVPEDLRVLRLLEQALVFAEAPLSVEVAVALGLQGRVSARPILRDALEQRLAPDLDPQIVTALAGYADQVDLKRLRDMFPGDGRPDLDLALARALVGGRDGLGLRLVRAGVWVRDFHRSVLAAHLLAEFQGLQALHEELASPPPLVSAVDLRRIGFVLGELGGLGEVEHLARRRTSADPVLQGAYLGALAARTF